MRILWIVMAVVIASNASEQLVLTPKEKSFLSERIVHVGMVEKPGPKDLGAQALCKAYVQDLGDKLGLWLKYENVSEDEIAGRVLLGTLDMGCVEMSGRIEMNHKMLDYHSDLHGEVQVALLQRPDWVDLHSASEKVWAAQGEEQKAALTEKAREAEHPSMSKDVLGWIVIAVGLLIAALSFVFWRMMKKELPEDTQGS